MAALKFSFEHVALAAQDPAALKDWYLRVLGALVVCEMPQQPPAYLLDLGGVLIEIYPARNTSELTRDNGLAGWRHIALRVDSLEPARELLAARGLRFEDPVKPAGGGGRVLFFRDLEGNLLHLVERPLTGWSAKAGPLPSP